MPLWHFWPSLPSYPQLAAVAPSHLSRSNAVVAMPTMTGPCTILTFHTASPGEPASLMMERLLSPAPVRVARSPDTVMVSDL